MLDEIANVVNDIKKSNGDLQHRGHVVALARMCALEPVSAYGYRGDDAKKKTKKKYMAIFIQNHFPKDYKRHAHLFYKLYRCAFVHSWNLFEATILPRNEGVRKDGDTLSFGLLNFFDALKAGVTDFLTKVKKDTMLQQNCLLRYRNLRKTARP